MTSDRWPHSEDTPLTRARRIARAYREHLRTANPQLCAALDDTMRAFGEGWVAPSLDIYTPDQAITTALAAELVNVRPGAIRRWACLDHPELAGKKLLPRFGWSGRERTYLAGDVVAAREVMDRVGRVT